MDIKLVIFVAVAALFVWLGLKSQDKKGGPDQLCASEVIKLIKKDNGVSSKEIAEVFKAHERTRADIDVVTKLIVSQLTKAAIRKEDQQDIKVAIRQAKLMLPD